MKLRIFLDTNVFIYAFEFPKSNSRKIIELLNEGKIEAVISERVIKEVQAYFKRYYGKDLASLFRNYLILSCTIVPTIHVKDEMKKYRRKIKEKDLEQLAVVKKFGIKFLVSFDKDFKKFKEYKTLKIFIEDIGLIPNEEEF